MQWYEITVPIPLCLLEPTYTFLWPYVNGLDIEKREKDFLLKSYIFSPYPHSLMRKLNNFLHIRSKSYQAKYAPPSISEVNGLSTDTFIIVPTPTSHTPPFGIPILIQRGRAFGIGSHPCTIYCLQGLKDILRDELNSKYQINKVLDAGAGTGILSIAAAKLGAKDITGVEISDESVIEAKENVRINGMTKEIQILHCSVTEIRGQFDLILANLYGHLLVEIASSLIEQLSPKGWLILGGMAIPHDEVVISTFTNHGLKECIRYRDEEWSAAVLQKRTLGDLEKNLIE